MKECLPEAASKKYTLIVEYSLAIVSELSREPVKHGGYLLNAGFPLIIFDYLSSGILKLREYALNSLQFLIQQNKAWRKLMGVGGDHSVPVNGCIPLLISMMSSSSVSLQQSSIQILSKFLNDEMDENRNSANLRDENNKEVTAIDVIYKYRKQFLEKLLLILTNPTITSQTIPIINHSYNLLRNFLLPGQL